MAQANATLLVSAAASLEDALKEVQPLFQQTQPNTKVNYNFGASGALQQQIEQGAPADIFFSAATKQIDFAAIVGYWAWVKGKRVSKTELPFTCLGKF